MSSRWIDRSVALFTIGVSIGLYILAEEFPLGSDIFPKFTLITVIVLALLMVVETVLVKGGAGKKAAAPAKIYVCPMGDYQGDKPDKCPKCGMNLVEKK